MSGNKGLKLNKQLDLYQELKTVVQKGRDLEIDCETLIEKVRSYYEGE